MELPEPIARNALHLLQHLSERERHPELGLPEIPEISKVIGLTHHETSDLIDILESEEAIKVSRSIAGGAASRLTGQVPSTPPPNILGMAPRSAPFPGRLPPQEHAHHRQAAEQDAGHGREDPPDPVRVGDGARQQADR